MSLRDQESFLSNIHPFEVLTEEQMNLCIKNMDIAYYPKDTTILSPDKNSTHYFIIIKGTVHEISTDNELVMDFHQEDSFDANALIYNECKNNFVVKEDLICYELEKKAFLTLIEQNAEFKEFFLNNLVNKLQNLKEKKYTSELSSFMIARVDDKVIHTPYIVKKCIKLIYQI